MISWERKYVMKIKMIGIMILLLCTAFMLGMDGCDGSKETPSTVKTVQADSKPLNQKVTPPKQEAEQVDDELTLENPNESLSPREYGRENPFEPLVRSSSARRSSTPRSNARETTDTKPKIVIRLTAILGENSAIFNEGGADKSVSVGDTIGGMAVLEIQINEGKVVLGKGDEKRTISLGEKI
jgi:type II secretory pathway component PulC